MSDRYTRTDAENAARRLADACGREYGYHEGGWILDYVPVYGGCTIAELLPEGGEHRPFGHNRVPLRQFCEQVNFALSALYEARAGLPV